MKAFITYKAIGTRLIYLDENFNIKILKRYPNLMEKKQTHAYSPKPTSSNDKIKITRSSFIHQATRKQGKQKQDVASLPRIIKFLPKSHLHGSSLWLLPLDLCFTPLLKP